MADYFVGTLWLLVMFYIMLFCQHRICEAYFVPALNVLMDKMGASSNPWLKRFGDPGVAGATFMALGANGPELFTNLFALFAHSDGGIGVVIGSEIFNLLVIIGMSIIYNKGGGMLGLEKVPFTRDVIWYSISIALLVWAIGDKKITLMESLIMLGAGLCYWACVYFTDDIAAKMGIAKLEMVEGDAIKTKVHGVQVEVEEHYHSRMADGHGGGKGHFDFDPAAGDGFVATDLAPEVSEAAKAAGRNSVGFGAEGLLGGAMLYYKDLSEVSVKGEGVVDMIFESKGVTLEVTCKGGSVDRDKLLENLKQYSLQGKNKTWIHNYGSGPMEAFAHCRHAMSHGTIMGKFHGVLELFVDVLLRTTLFWCDVKDIRKEGRWPLLFVMSMLWLAVFSFLMVQVMGLISTNIPVLSPLLLGVTLGAIGTSLPNAMGSIIMASQGKSAAAIGNAFGSNVQNVFLAMGGPWLIYILSGSSDPENEQKLDPKYAETPCHCVLMTAPAPEGKHGQSIDEGVSWMLGTLVLVVFFAIMPTTCSFNKMAGLVFVSLYVFYLAWTVYEFEIMPP
jgi:Ca2+/Na+ antiporter